MELAAHTTRAIYNGIVDSGADPKELLDLADLTEAQLDIDDDGKHFALWQAGESLLGRPEIALHIGSQSSPAHRGVVGAIFISSKNLRMALDSAVKYMSILVDYISFDITEDKQHIYITYAFSKDYFHHYGLEYISAAIINWISVLLEQPIYPVNLSYQFTKPTNTAAHYHLFKCPINFEQPKNLIVLSSSLFKLQKNNYSAYLHQTVADKAKEILEEENSNGTLFKNRVLSIISGRLYNGNFSADDIASSLNLSTRTYHRRLTALNTSHQHLVDEVRKNIALSYLLDPTCIIKNIPYMLGYSDFRGFSRAFKRWTGYSPMQYIKAHMSSESV